MGSALGSIFGMGGKPSSVQKGAANQQAASLQTQRDLDQQAKTAQKEAEKAKLKKGKASLALIKSRQGGGGSDLLQTGRGKLLGN